MKKAISPLISWILLIGLIIAMGALVSQYLVKQAKQVKYEQYGSEFYCEGAAISIEDFSTFPHAPYGVSEIEVFNFTILNRGRYTIKELLVSVNYLEGSTKKEKTLKLMDEYGWGEFPPGEGCCPPIQPGSKTQLYVANLSGGILEVSIVPQIEIENTVYTCNQKVFKSKIS